MTSVRSFYYSIGHTVILSYCHTIKLSYCRTVKLPCFYLSPFIYHLFCVNTCNPLIYIYSHVICHAILYFSLLNIGVTFHVICHLSFVICHLLFIICHLSSVICNAAMLLYWQHDIWNIKQDRMTSVRSFYYSIGHTVILSYCHTIKLSYCRTVKLPCFYLSPFIYHLFCVNTCNPLIYIYSHVICHAILYFSLLNIGVTFHVVITT